MLSETEAREIYQTFRSRGVVIFDTAEGYGGGTSEKRLGRLLHGKQRTKSDNTSSTETPLNIQGDNILMTKFLPVPWRFTHKHFENALRASNMRMGVTECPIYLLHSPMHISRDIEYWVESAAICKRKGLLKYFGLSNCSSHQVKRAVDAGKKFGVKVVVNQVHYSLLDYDSDALKKMQKTCDELGVAIIAYNSLGQGLLCDNLTREKFTHNKPAKMMDIQWGDLVPLRTALREIADAHSTKKDGTDEANARVSMAQVALCWCRAHNTIPLVGCRSKKQAEDSLSSLTFDLTADEVSALDALALNRCTLDSPGWRRKLFVALAGVVMTACRWMDWSPASQIAAE
ncbi:hypothetical protein ACHAWF_007650 [Thalassiosira exigua]